MKSIADPAVLDHLVERPEGLRADTPRRWGTMSPGEMLCHLGDATDSILERDPDERGRVMTEPARNRPFLKWIALRAPLAWPKGIKTPPEVDPPPTAPSPPTSTPTASASSAACTPSPPPPPTPSPRAISPSAG